jgi:succinoglycan biosynthesis transport protein ExoP
MNQSPPPVPPGAAGFGMPASLGVSKFSPVDPVRVLKQYKWVLIATAVIGVMLGIATYILLVRYAPVFVSRATVAVRPDITDPMDPGGGNTRESEDQFQRFQGTQALRMGSSGIMRAVLGRQDVKATAWYQRYADQTPGEIEREMGDILTIRPVPDTELISVAVKTFSKEDPHVIANAIVDEYIRRVVEENTLGQSDLRRVFNDTANRLREDIERLRDQLDAVILDAELSVVQSNYHEIQAMFQALVEERRELAAFVDEARANYEGIIAARDAGPIEFTAEEVYSVENDMKIRAIDDTIIRLRQNRHTALERYGPKHRVIEEIDVGIRAAEIERERVMQELLIKLQDTKVASAAATLAAAESRYAAASAKLEESRIKRRDLNSRLTEYERLNELLESKQAELTDLGHRQTEMDMATRRPDRTRVVRVEQARRPEFMTSPKLPHTLLGVEILVLGLVGGLVYLRELLDSRIKGPACSKLLPQNDLIGVIPSASEDPHIASGIENAVRDSPEGLLAEQFRQLRTEVLNRLDDRRYKTLMVTGCQPGSGVSVTTVNLGASVAANGRKVVILEANFRRPSLAGLLGADGEIGAADLLAGRATVDQAAQPTGITGLDVITIGHADNHFLELLESQAFGKVIRELEDRYDLILVDAPPMSIVGDSRLLANRVQTVLLVVRAMIDKRGLVSRIMNQLKSSRADLIGLVINGVRSSSGGYFRRNFEAYYAYQNGGRVGESESPRRRRGSRRRSGQSTEA